MSAFSKLPENNLKDYHMVLFTVFANSGLRLDRQRASLENTEGEQPEGVWGKTIIAKT